MYCDSFWVLTLAGLAMSGCWVSAVMAVHGSGSVRAQTSAKLGSLDLVSGKSLAAGPLLIHCFGLQGQLDRVVLLGFCWLVIAWKGILGKNGSRNIAYKHDFLSGNLWSSNHVAN